MTDPNEQSALGLWAEAHKAIGTGDMARAEALLVKAVAMQPLHAGALSDLGACAERLGKDADAERWYRKALAAEPALPGPHLNRAMRATRIAAWSQASTRLRRAAASGAASGALLRDTAQIDLLAGRPDLGGRAARRSIALDPGGDVPTAFLCLAACLIERKVVGPAAIAIRRGLRFAGLNVAALANAAELLRKADVLAEAGRAARRALVLSPSFAEIHNTLGMLALDEDVPVPATTALARALALVPGKVEWRHNLTVALKHGGQFDRALALLRPIVDAAPGHAQGQWSLSTALMAMGRIPEAWETFEWRRPPEPDKQERVFPQPWWDGRRISDGALLVWGEQGLGDEIRFGGMLPDLQDVLDDVVVECDPRMVAPFRRSLPRMRFVGRTNPPAKDLFAPSIRRQCAMGSLVRWLRPNLASFYRRAGFIVPDPDRLSHWRRVLADLGPGPRVGIAWRSSRQDAMGRRMHTTIDQWGPIFAIPGVTFVCLQYGDIKSELAYARERFGVTPVLLPGLDLFADVDDLFNASAALDLAIGTSTTALSPAGAVGTPTWMLQVDGHAMWLGTSHDPWFPSTRGFRRKAGESWAPAIAAVAKALSAKEFLQPWNPGTTGT